MIKSFIFLTLFTSSIAYALSPVAYPLSATVVPKSEEIKSLTLPPIDNVHIKINANTIAGTIKAFETDSCSRAVDFLKPRVGNKPMLIMDGGYIVYINNKFVLDSSSELLFSWMNRCQEKYSK